MMNLGPLLQRSGTPGFRPLVTPLVIVSLLIASVVVWIGVMNAAGQHSAGLQKWASAPPVEINEGETPEKYTQPFVPGVVPLGASRMPVYLYVSPTTTRYFKSVGGDYGALVAPWRSFLKKHFAYLEIGRLDGIPGGASSVLVVPSAVALSKSERRQLIAFQQQGGNILATWSLGGRSENGSWQGHGLLGNLFGVGVPGEVRLSSEERFLNLLGELPLTAGYPAGQRIWLEGTAEKMLRLSGGNSAALYTDWVRNPVPLETSSAVSYGEHGAERHHARWVAIGFAETTWGKQAGQLSGLLQNALHWLGHGITVTKAAWPVPYRAAYLIEMDTEDGFGNAQRFARMMEEIDAKATFYCLTSEAVRFPLFLRDLAKRHEIGYHGDVHVGFVAQPEAVQRQRLERMRTDMKSILGDTTYAVGFRAPFEQYERSTERLLYSAGLRHHAADPNRTDARLPFFSKAGSDEPDRALVVLPRTQHDDVNLLKDKRGDNDVLLGTLTFDYLLNREMGSLGLLSVHSQNFAEDSLLAVAMPKLLKQVTQHRQQVWITSASEIADWWRERERLRYSVSGTSNEFILKVAIAGQRPLGKVALVLSNRVAAEALSVQPVSPGISPAIQPIDSFRTAIVFEGMSPGRYAFRVTPVRQSRQPKSAAAG
jgi:peptidoglycan/xylan/chitin deacetylase (PgdA/CDA1 family)